MELKGPFAGCEGHWPGLKHTPRDILLGLLRPKQYANGSKPDGLLPKASRGEGRVKQSQGLVAWGSSGESHFHFPPLCPTAFPLPRGWFPSWDPTQSFARCLLSKYYVPGAWEKVLSKPDRAHPHGVNSTAGELDITHVISCDQCYLL